MAPRRSRTPLHVPQRQAGAGAEHQRHCGTARAPGRAGDGQGAAAGGAAGRFTAGVAHQRGGVAGPGHLDQDRAPFQAFLGGPPGRAREPGNPGQRVMLEFVAVGCVQDPRDRPPHDGPVRFHGPGPSPRRPAAPFRCCANGPRAGTRPLPGRPEQEDFAGVRVRGALLDVEVVAVVPADHEAEVRHRCVGRGPGARRRPRRRR